MINRVLFYNSGGGIGDAIQILPLINSLKEEFNKANFYYLCSHQNHFNTSLGELNCNITTINLDIKYFGFRWWHLFVIKKKLKNKNIKKFDIIIDLQSKFRNSLILKMIPHNFFISTCFNFFFNKPSIVVKKEIKINNTILKVINKTFKKDLKLADFSLETIDNKYMLESKKLLPNNNYVGFSITQGNIYRKKEWPMENIINFTKKIIENNKVPVFFIEKKNQNLIKKFKKLFPNALFPENESNLSSPALVTCLGKRLDFAISIDNGVMHMLSLAKIPMVILFGPTNSEKFAPEYKDLIILDSKKIKNTSDISAISVEDVLQALMHHSSFLR